MSINQSNLSFNEGQRLTRVPRPSIYLSTIILQSCIQLPRKTIWATTLSSDLLFLQHCCASASTDFTTHDLRSAVFFFFQTGRISKVFISHLHGDHLFGLPGLLCTVSLNVNPECQGNLKCVDIYGPRGLRTFLRVALGLTGSQLLFPYAGMSVTCSAHRVSPHPDCWCCVSWSCPSLCCSP